MSLDFSLQQLEITDVYSGNMTHNVTPMWKLAGIYDDLYNSDGKKAKDVVKNLKKGLRIMKFGKRRFSKLNPENGWGSYESAVKYLKEIIDACELYPESDISISK